MIRLPLTFILSLMSLAPMSALASETPSESRPPNIVLILADDLGWGDLGFAGHPRHQTPHIDGLAAEGRVFLHAYSNGPNCAPSRACLMTGRYGPRHGIYTVGKSTRGRSANRRIIPTPNRTRLPANLIALPAALKAAGYVSACVGKWHLGPDPLAHGFDVNVGGNATGHPRGGYFSPYRNPRLPDGPEGEYLTDRLTDEAVRFMKEHHSRPFFLYLSHYAVHTPIQGRTDLVRKYRSLPEDHRPRHPAFAAMVESLDESVGRVLACLAELELADDTLVVFLSDNGGHGNYSSMGGLRGSKGMLYEGGVRVPAVVRFPGRVAGGTTSNTPIMGHDLYPTFLEVAGLGTRDDLDGESLVPVFGEAGELPRDALFWHFPAYLEGGRKRLWRTTPAGSVRQGSHKLIEFFEDGRLELYDLAADPAEENDLAATEPEKTQALHDLLKRWRAKVGAPVPSEANPGFVGPPRPEYDVQGVFHYDRAAPAPTTSQVLPNPARYDSGLAVTDENVWLAWLEYTPGKGDGLYVGPVPSEGSGERVPGTPPMLGAPTLTRTVPIPRVGDRPERASRRDGQPLPDQRLWLTYEACDPTTGTWDVFLRLRHGKNDYSPAVRVTPSAGNDIGHQAAGVGDVLWIVWQGERDGQFDIFARSFRRRGERQTPEASEVIRLSTSPRGDWHPAVAVTNPGHVCVAWDRFDGQSYDVVCRWVGDGLPDATWVVASGPRFQARPSLAADAENRVWALWEEGELAWGAPYRSVPQLWNNMTDDSGPLHRYRALRLATVHPQHGVKEFTPALPLPSLDAPPPRASRRPGVRHLGAFYERGVITIGGGGWPWILYRHYYDPQLGQTEAIQHHVEAGWQIYARRLDGNGWGPLFGFDGAQRDGLQRLSVAAAPAGVAAVWTTGRTDRRDDPDPRGLRLGSVNLVGTGTIPLVTDPTAVTRARPIAAPATSRPRVEVGGQELRLFFGDLHRHTDLSLCFPFFDGSIDDAYRYAIDVARLDFLAITDHTRDIAKGDVGSQLWWRSQKEVTRHRLAPRFFPYFAYERSHRDTDHNVISLRADRLRNFPPPLPEFWKQIGGDTFTIPHNPFIGKVWDYQDGARRPLLEIYQGFRDQESTAAAHDALARGYRLGFIASSDHLSTRASYAGVWSPEASEVGVFRSLQSRRTYAATAPITLRVTCGDHWMGDEVPAGASRDLTIHVEGTAALEEVALVGPGDLRLALRLPAGGQSSDGQGSDDEGSGRRLETVARAFAGAPYVYVVVRQRDGHRAWSSPIWFEN